MRRKIRNAHTRSEMKSTRYLLKEHLNKVFDARKELASNKLLADGDEGFCLVMADASDQAKTGSPHIRQVTTPHITVYHRIPPHRTSFFTSPHRVSPHSTSPHLILHITSPHLTSPHHTSTYYIRQGGRAGSRVKKIKQQFIGVIVHGRGYYLYRRLPVTPKGANLTCTLLIDLFAKGLLRRVHTLVIQWDGKKYTQ